MASGRGWQRRQFSRPDFTDSPVSCDSSTKPEVPCPRGPHESRSLQGLGFHNPTGRGPHALPGSAGSDALWGPGPTGRRPVPPLTSGPGPLTRSQAGPPQGPGPPDRRGTQGRAPLGRDSHRPRAGTPRAGTPTGRGSYRPGLLRAPGPGSTARHRCLPRGGPIDLPPFECQAWRSTPADPGITV